MQVTLSPRDTHSASTSHISPFEPRLLDWGQWPCCGRQKPGGTPDRMTWPTTTHCQTPVAAHVEDLLIYQYSLAINANTLTPMSGQVTSYSSCDSMQHTGKVLRSGPSVNIIMACQHKLSLTLLAECSTTGTCWGNAMAWPIIANMVTQVLLSSSSAS